LSLKVEIALLDNMQGANCAGIIGDMIRIETHKVIPFLLFLIAIAALLFLPYFSQVELPVAQMSAFGSETVRI